MNDRVREKGTYKGYISDEGEKRAFQNNIINESKRKQTDNAAEMTVCKYLR